VKSTTLGGVKPRDFGYLKTSIRKGEELVVCNIKADMMVWGPEIGTNRNKKRVDYLKKGLNRN